jgi:hypothetical protein
MRTFERRRPSPRSKLFPENFCFDRCSKKAARLAVAGANVTKLKLFPTDLRALARLGNPISKPMPWLLVEPPDILYEVAAIYARAKRLLHSAKRDVDRCYASAAGVPSVRRTSAAATTGTVQSWRVRALTLPLLGIGAPATIGQPATAYPCSRACHAHAPHAHDGVLNCTLAGTLREELVALVARRRGLSVATRRP